MRFHTFLFKPDDGAGEGAPPPDPQPAPAADPTPAPAPAGFQISEDEWKQTQGALSYLVSMFQEPEGTQDPDPDPDDEGFDFEAYVNQAVDARLQPVRPLLDATVKERGEKEMQRIFAEMKTEVGDFDPKLAERTANSFLQEYGGDPVEATKAGARYAAEVRAAERKAGETTYRERPQRGPADYDPPAEGGAQKTREKAKSYDEVIERWAGEAEA